jgi:hypothetical protein
LFNGALHSTAWSRSHKFILSFDVNDERFREIMLPQNYEEDDILGHPMFRLAVLKGSLALFVCGSDICYIWVMRDYGVVESWTKISVRINWVDKFFCCTDNGELLINRIGRDFVSYDPESLNEKNLGIQSPY